MSHFNSVLEGSLWIKIVTQMLGILNFASRKVWNHHQIKMTLIQTRWLRKSHALGNSTNITGFRQSHLLISSHENAEMIPIYSYILSLIYWKSSKFSLWILCTVCREYNIKCCSHFLYTSKINIVFWTFFFNLRKISEDLEIYSKNWGRRHICQLKKDILVL